MVGSLFQGKGLTTATAHPHDPTPHSPAPVR